MCNSGAKDNLGQVSDFIGWALGATVCKRPHAGTAETNDRATSGSYFNIGEVGMQPVLGIARGAKHNERRTQFLLLL
jgi:hypothetical protein